MLTLLPCWYLYILRENSIPIILNFYMNELLARVLLIAGTKPRYLSII